MWKKLVWFGASGLLTAFIGCGEPHAGTSTPSDAQFAMPPPEMLSVGGHCYHPHCRDEQVWLLLPNLTSDVPTDPGVEIRVEPAGDASEFAGSRWWLDRAITSRPLSIWVPVGLACEPRRYSIELTVHLPADPNATNSRRPRTARVDRECDE